MLFGILRRLDLHRSTNFTNHYNCIGSRIRLPPQGMSKTVKCFHLPIACVRPRGATCAMIYRHKVSAQFDSLRDLSNLPGSSSFSRFSSPSGLSNLSSLSNLSGLSDLSGLSSLPGFSLVSLVFGISLVPLVWLVCRLRLLCRLCLVRLLFGTQARDHFLHAARAPKSM